MRYSIDTLMTMTTIRHSHDADLKFEDKTTRVWLSRLGKEDGEPYSNTVYIEQYIDGRWEISSCYDGDSV